MASKPKPSLVVTKVDGTVGAVEEKKGSLKKTKPSIESPNYLQKPKKIKKMQEHTSNTSISSERSLTKAQIEDLREAFNFFDKDNDGYIVTREVGNVLRSIGQNPTDAEIIDIVNELDVDGNGKIDFAEFAAMMSTRMKSPNEMVDDLKAAFKLFDINGDGLISVEELRTVMQSIGEKLTAAEAKAIMDAWDLNKDGMLDYAEFSMAMCADSIFKN